MVGFTSFIIYVDVSINLQLNQLMQP